MQGVQGGRRVPLLPFLWKNHVNYVLSGIPQNIILGNAGVSRGTASPPVNELCYVF